MATTCRTCGQANADGTEYCVRCGTRMPDPSSTQLVGAGGQAAEEYPWEPPAEWDPGDISAGGTHTPPPPTWVATPPPPAQDQVGWNTGHDTGAGYPAATAPQWGSQPPAYPPTPPPSQGKSKKPWIIGATAIVVIGAIVAVVLVATGGKKKGPALNGVQTQSASDALTTSRQALRDSKSAEISGTVRSSGQSIRFDVTLSGSNNSKGTLTINNNDVQLIMVDQTVYLKGDQDFLKKYAGNNQQVLDQLNGKWLKSNSTSDFALFTLDGFAGLLKGGSGSQALNPTVTQSELNGQKVVVVTQKDGSTLDIANTGPAVPLRLDSKGTDGGTVTFANYNKPVSITAPPSSDVFDVSNGGGGATVTGTYTCTGSDSSTDGGTLTLNTNSSYTVSGGGIGGSWGASGDQVAFAGGALDQYAATWNGSDTLDLKGSGTNASVSFTCVKQ